MASTRTSFSLFDPALVGPAVRDAFVKLDPRCRNTGYLDFSANVPVVDKLTFNGHVGYTHLSSDLRNAVNTTTGASETTVTTPAYASYVDWKAGATYDLGSGFSVAGAVVGATKKSVWGDVNKTRFIATISKTL